MSSTDWEKLKDNLEPAARNYYFNLEHDIQLSIAISLKRIADVICRPPPVVANLSPEDAKKFEEQWNNLSVLNGAMSYHTMFNKS